VHALADQLQFMRGELIALMGGNRSPDYSNGTTSYQLLANKPDICHLGICFAIRLSFNREKTKTLWTSNKPRCTRARVAVQAWLPFQTEISLCLMA
jgi:hypothetical protein